MLRIVKHCKPETPIVKGWNVRYLFADTSDEIGTIMCHCYQWTKLPFPKKESLRTPKMLPKWFSKLLQKKFGIRGEPFTSNNEFKLIYSKSDLRKYIHDCVIFPLFEHSMKDYTDIQTSLRIPEFLKFEIRSTMEKYYSNIKNEVNTCDRTDVCW